MALTVEHACASASEAETWPAWPAFLSVIFVVYIGLDTLLAAAVIVRKATEAESVSRARGQSGPL